MTAPPDQRIFFSGRKFRTIPIKRRTRWNSGTRFRRREKKFRPQIGEKLSNFRIGTSVAVSRNLFSEHRRRTRRKSEIFRWPILSINLDDGSSGPVSISWSRGPKFDYCSKVQRYATKLAQTLQRHLQNDLRSRNSHLETHKHIFLGRTELKTPIWVGAEIEERKEVAITSQANTHKSPWKR